MHGSNPASCHLPLPPHLVIRRPRCAHLQITAANGCAHPLLRQEMARSRPIDSKGKKGYKVLVLNEVDRLTKEAQHSLRRTMEKYSAACRLVLCCNNASRVRPAADAQSMIPHPHKPTSDE
jgi:hypothetical protein